VKFGVSRIAAIVVLGYLVFALLQPLWQFILGFDANYGDISALDLASEAEPLGALGGISWQHPLGVEPQTGRDILLRLSAGIRTSAFISLAAVVGSLILGVTVGVIAGYSGGWIDNVLNRLIDVVLSIPAVFFALAAVPVMQTWIAINNQVATNSQRIPILIFIMSLFGWPEVARVVRSEIKLLRKSDFVVSAQLSGGRLGYISTKHLYPHIWLPVALIGLVNFITFIKIEASLSLLGSGVIEPLASWGTMISLAPQYISSSPTYVVIIAVSVLIFVSALTRLVDLSIGLIRREPLASPF
jgi:peptide/nickel transport system permease protein